MYIEYALMYWLSWHIEYDIFNILTYRVSSYALPLPPLTPLQRMQVQVSLLHTLYISYLVCVRNLYRTLSHTHTPPSFCYAFAAHASHAAHAAHAARAGTAGTGADWCDTGSASWYVYAFVDIDIYEFESTYTCACIGYIYHVGLYVCVCKCRCIH